MENYILRIYRRDAQRPDRVVGMVEDVANGETLSFRSLGELTAFLCERGCLHTQDQDKRLELV